MSTNPNMEAIQTITATTSVASIDFTNIPQGYTDLLVYISARSSLNTQAGVKIQFNSNSSAVYDIRNITGNGSTPNSGTATNQTFGYDVSLTNPANYTANTFSNGYIYIPNYTSSNHKSFSVDTVAENNATLADCALEAGIWRNTAAITSVNLSDLGGGNFVQYSSATLYGVTKFAEDSPKAVGGAVTEDSSYYYHTFKSSGNFIPSQSLTGDVLVIAGGGSGASSLSVGGGGGGGAGGLVYSSSQSFANATNYTITVGAGGAFGNPDGGNNGSNSNLTGGALSLTAAVGGGKGGDYNSNGFSGGSGGGAGQNATTGGSPTSAQGSAGGSPGNTTVSGLCGSGGGGFASAGTVPSGAGAFPPNPGDGGAGTSTYSAWGSATATGQNVGGTYYYAGGGGGGAHGSQSTNTAFGVGGNGGGGRGAWTNTSVAAFTAGVSGTQGTGSGGGGGCGNNGLPGLAGNGGSGIVIVRYAK